MAMQTTIIPSELAEKIRAFVTGRKVGNITLNVKDGCIVSWQFTEMGRVDRCSIDKEDTNHLD